MWGSPFGGIRGGTIYVVTVHKWPHPLRPLWVTLWPQFLSCELIFIIFQSYIKIMGLSQSLVRILGQPPFNPLLLRGKYCIEFTCWSQPQFSSNFKKILQASSIYLNDHCPKRASNSDKNNVKKAILTYILPSPGQQSWPIWSQCMAAVHHREGFNGVF